MFLFIIGYHRISPKRYLKYQLISKYISKTIGYHTWFVRKWGAAIFRRKIDEHGFGK
jgi:hypothetical protein